MQTLLSPPLGLSVELRERTREAHAAAEVAFHLNRRLVDLGTYGELLTALRGFYGQAEDALGAMPGWERLAPPVDVNARRRAALADDDLRRLGMGAPTCRRQEPIFSQPWGTLAGALGCLYVLEGSTLGGQIVARRAQAALGAQLPVAFFSGFGRHEVGPRWRALQASLDGFGLVPGDPAVAEEAVQSAKDTFGALAARLDSTPAPR